MEQNKRQEADLCMNAKLTEHRSGTVQQLEENFIEVTGTINYS